MLKWLFHILIFATSSGKYKDKEKPLKRQRKLGLCIVRKRHRATKVPIHQKYIKAVSSLFPNKIIVKLESTLSIEQNKRKTQTFTMRSKINNELVTIESRVIERKSA